MASIAINGLGRVGRAALKIIEQANGAQVVAVNDLILPDNLAYLLRYDTVYGRWHTTVTADGDALVVGGRKIPVLAERDPAGLPWKTLGVDLVLECTGVFRREEDLRKHLSTGARRVILSAPARTETVATVVHGVNQAPPDEQVVSADIIGDPRASVVDAAMTRVVDGTLVKVMSWYDNEWGFACQMIREAFAALALPAPDLSQARP